MADKPLWRQVYDAVDSRIAPPLESAVQTPQFATVLSTALRVQGETRRFIERRSRGVWHLLNLPAGSDVTRLREQVVTLDRRIRELSNALEEANRRAQPAESGRNGRSHGRSPATGGRAQRATGS